MNYRLEIQKTELLYRGFFTMQRFTLSHSLFVGGMCPPIQRELFHREDAVAVLLYDPGADAVVMIEQFRIGNMNDRNCAWAIELVAGFQEEGESVEEVVRREVMEEAGCTVGKIEPVCEFYINPANTSDRIILVCAEVDSTRADGIHGVKEEGEDIKVHVLSCDDAFQAMKDGRINSATPILALQWLAMNRERLLQTW